MLKAPGAELYQNACGVVNEQKKFCSHQCSPECSMNKSRAYISINEIGNRVTLSIYIYIYINEIGNRMTLKKVKVRHYLELLTLETRKLLASTKSKKTKMKIVKMLLIWKLLKYY